MPVENTKKGEKQKTQKKENYERWALNTRERGQSKQRQPGPYQVKGLALVPINWNTLRPRKLKMEAWSNDTTKKEEKRKSRKQENRYQKVLRAVIP